MNFEEDAKQEEAGEDNLARVVKMAELMVEQEKIVANLENDLRDAKANLLKMQTEDLPDLMTEIGMAAVTLKDGSSVQVVPDITCAISIANKQAAHAWLIENKFGGLIKTQVVTEFERGQVELAKEYMEKANAEFPENLCESKESVHPGTLKSFVKEQMEKLMENADDPDAPKFPMELFSVREFNRAKYIKAKGKSIKK